MKHFIRPLKAIILLFYCYPVASWDREQKLVQSIDVVRIVETTALCTKLANIMLMFTKNTIAMQRMTFLVISQF